MQKRKKSKFNTSSNPQRRRNNPSYDCKDILEKVNEKVPDASCCLGTKYENGVEYVFDLFCKKKMSFDVQNIVKHLHTEKHKSAKAKSMLAQEKSASLLEQFHLCRKITWDTNFIDDASRKMDESTKIRMDFKKAQLKSFSSQSTLSTYVSVAQRYIEEGELAGTNHWMELVPVIHSEEISNICKSFSHLSKETVLIVDTTTLVDEQAGVVSRSICEDTFFVTQALVGLWSLNHHLTGMNNAFILEQAWKRINRTRKDVIAVPADRVSANSVSYREVLRDAHDLFLIGCFSHTNDNVGKQFDCSELDEFMIAVRQLLGNSTDAKRVFREMDSNERDLAGYAAIRCRNEWVQLFQIFNKGLECIYNVAKEMSSNELCKKSSLKIIQMWENDFTQAKIRVQCAAKIDYGQPFCKACFNLEGDADGLSFVTGMEIQKLTSAITDTNLNIDGVIKACTQAEEIVRSAFGRKNAIIEEKKDNLNITLNKLADKISDIEQLRVRTIEEGVQLSIDDRVTLKRRNNHSQVRGTVTHVHTTENGEVTYNIKPDQGADFLNYSEFLLVKSSTKRRALQKRMTYRI